MTRGRIAAIVLAAGTSSRLGQPKQLLPVDGQPLLSRTLDVVRASTLQPRVLVLGGYADQIDRQVRHDDLSVVFNPDYQQGQSTSLAAGLAALPISVEGAVIVLGDQPLATPWLLDDLAERFDPATHVAVRPRYADGPGNPVLLGRALFEELLQLTGDVGARDVLKRHQDRIAEVDCSSRNAPRDVDTLEDYAAFLKDWSSSGAPDVPRYCLRCGSGVEFQHRYARLRPVCPQCGFVYFYDPKVTVAVIIEIDGKIVMHQRAGDPGAGKWTFPSGFVDRGEIVIDAARREVFEEVGLEVDDLQLMDVYSAPGETVVLIVFHTSLSGQLPIAGDETTDVRLFTPDDLPELAFPRDRQIVDDWLAKRGA